MKCARCLVSVVCGLTIGVFCGCRTTDAREERGTKVLMIGNSFSICLLENLPQVAAAGGVELDLASLYIGGCSLQRHWENAERDGEAGFKPYTFGRNRFGEVSRGRANVCDVLRMEKWDIVTIQQVSHESWRPETFEIYGAKLVAKIRELAPQAKIFVQETWSYTPWDGRLSKWGIGQDEMYERLHAAYGAFAGKLGLQVIPFGTAVQKWRKRLPVRYTVNSLGGDVVGGRWQDPKDHFRHDAQGDWLANCDVFHLNRRGEYFQALVWATALFGLDLSEFTYRPDFVTEAEARLMCDIAMELEPERRVAEWTYDADGSLVVSNTVLTNGTMPKALQRPGLTLRLDGELENVAHFGRGPRENYIDRRADSSLGRHSSSDDGRAEFHVRPQDNGSRSDVRWIEFMDLS